MSNALILGLIAAGSLIAAILITLHEKSTPKILKIRIGGVELTANAIEHVIGRMRDRILQLTDENEQLRRQLWAANVRLSHLNTIKPSISWEAYKNEKAS